MSRNVLLWLVAGGVIGIILPLAQGQREQAIEHFQHAQEIDPQGWNSQQAARELAKLDAAPDAPDTTAGEAATQ